MMDLHRNAATLAAFLTLTFPALAETSFERDIRPVLDAHCFECHGEEKKPKGGVNFERFKTDADVMRVIVHCDDNDENYQKQYY